MKLSSIRPIARLLARELAITALLILGVSFVVFIIIYLSPGDPFGKLLKGQAVPQNAAKGFLATFGVSSAWYAQYLAWLVNMAQGDFI
jgi:peptide/nickel transport system permease protein